MSVWAALDALRQRSRQLLPAIMAGPQSNATRWVRAVSSAYVSSFTEALAIIRGLQQRGLLSVHVALCHLQLVGTSRQLVLPVTSVHASL